MGRDSPHFLIREVRRDRMINKPATGRSEDIEALQGLLSRSALLGRQRNAIEVELKKVRAGVKGELEAAHHIDDQYRNLDNFAVIHDLRIEHEGEVAQIDHLVINLGLQIFVCETKHFTSGLACNDHGEWVGFYNGKPFGISSPILQNERHIRTLRRLLDTNPVWLKTGLRDPYFESFVLVSNGARIGRPEDAASVKGLDRVVKIERFTEEVRKAMVGSVFNLKLVKLMAGMVSAQTLREFAEGLASQHRPISFDYEAKFGIAPLGDVSSSCEKIKSEDSDAEDRDATKLVGDAVAKCDGCGNGVDKKVKWFCRRYKSRFDGKIFCRTCQAS
jgi:hypothetical protein